MFYSGGKAMPNGALNAAKPLTQAGGRGRTARPGRRGAAFARPAFELSVGSSLGTEYVVTGHIGDGPVTEIYRVWSTSRLCELACKVLRSHVDPRSRQARAFANEG